MIQSITRTGTAMIKILICDDDAAFAQRLSAQIRRILLEKDIQAQIHTHQYAENVPADTMERYDIAFLDIDFSGKSYTGIDIARALRSKRHDAVILFVTNFPEYAPEGYEVQAFRYLLKSAVPAKLESYLTQALAQLETLTQMLTINVYGETVRVAIEDVLYIEAQLHEVELHRLDPDNDTAKAYRFYASIGDLEETLVPQGFLRIHKSYLVNMRHIRKFQCREAELTDGTKLRVSEKNYAQLKKRYLLWKGR